MPETICQPREMYIKRMPPRAERFRQEGDKLQRLHQNRLSPKPLQNHGDLTFSDGACCLVIFHYVSLQIALLRTLSLEIT